VRYLVDTHLLVWAAEQAGDLSGQAQALMEDEANELVFSVVSLWEFVIKAGTGRSGFEGDAQTLRRGLLDNAYRELTVSAPHVLAVGDLPHLHRDSFDRLLIAQAWVEGLIFLTADAMVARYPGAILRV
jgi:PIN domain nuclease of toxin-antitoxin system